MVTFVGYFFKLWKHESPGENAHRLTPILIGYAFPEPRYKPEQSAEGWSYQLLLMVSVTVIVAFSLIFAVSLWYRRDDRKVRNRIEATAPPFVDLSEKP